MVSGVSPVVAVPQWLINLSFPGVPADIVRNLIKTTGKGEEI